MNQYYCPYCDEDLTHLNGMVLKLKGVLDSDHFKCSSNFFLPAAVGVYGVITENHLTLKDGAIIDFCCPNPKCDHSFTTSYDEDLANVKMVDDDGTERVVVFNRIYGKQSTFVVDFKEKKVENAYGADQENYIREFDKPINFFGE
ncbi:MAG: hypothetical protein JRH15_02765 [Deltaproteobacteria bacterium]|nr:hypothetical protein [Deltaproteobacteria bacterium]